MRESVHPRFRDICGIALEALPHMRDPATGLFCHKATSRGDGYELQGSNALYSAMVLVGLQSHGASTPWFDDVLDRVVQEALSGSSAGLLGTVLWTLALIEDPRAGEVLERIDRVVDPRAAASMDDGLVLSGLASAARAMPGLRDSARGAAEAFAGELQARFVEEAQLFAGSRTWTPARGTPGLRDTLNGGVTSFASQVYPLHGLALYCRDLHGSALPLLVRAAERLIASQGPRGQWWWQYSRRTGAVVEPYPVYSVHQDGMAFMALGPLEELSVGEYQSELWRGLDWVSGRNELNQSLVNDLPPAIWRCIQRRGSDPDRFGGISRLNHARLIARAAMGRGEERPREASAGGLELLRECRPYHLGWVLYAESLVTSASDTRPRDSALGEPREREPRP